jgi:hypothetical protein
LFDRFVCLIANRAAVVCSIASGASILKFRAMAYPHPQNCLARLGQYAFANFAKKSSSVETKQWVQRPREAHDVRLPKINPLAIPQ